MASFRLLLRSSNRCYAINLRSRITICGKRHLLSQAYNCSDVWEARRQSVILKDLNVYDFLSEIQKQAHHGNPVSATDIDVLLNCVSEPEQFDEAVRLLYNFRHSKKAAEMMDSTHSVFVRSCLQNGRDESLLRILDDPINYGVFLNSYDANLLMDHFLKNGNHRDAAKVASKIMLQEDFQRVSTCWLAALSCLKWIKEPLPDSSPAESSAGDAATPGSARSDEEMDDEIIMRLPYLKNHYDDDHFDITEYPALFGKTLAWTARSLNNKELSSNLMALGYGVKKDYHNTALVLRRQLETRTKLYAEVEQYVLKAGSAAAEIADEKPAESSSDAPSDAPKETDVGLEEVKTLIDQFHKMDLIIQEDLEETLTEELNKILPDLESKDIKERTTVLMKWNEIQQQRVENQVLRYLKNERLREIENERKSMKEMEEYLNFFENRTKLEISVHPELLKQEEEAKRKAEAEETQLPSDDKYVIPELTVRKEVVKLDF